MYSGPCQRIDDNDKYQRYNSCRPAPVRSTQEEFGSVKILTCERRAHRLIRRMSTNKKPMVRAAVKCTERNQLLTAQSRRHHDSQYARRRTAFAISLPAEIIDENPKKPGSMRSKKVTIKASDAHETLYHLPVRSSNYSETGSSQSEPTTK